MAVLQYIPRYITVHLGPPDSDAENVTVPFPDYVKNSACSELYPTWPDSAIEACVIAITSLVLNRVYNNYYRARGYNFDITNDPFFDQSFIRGRNLYVELGRIADRLLGSYMRLKGEDQPLEAKLDGGYEGGMPKWGAVNLALQGKDAYYILEYYYGDILIVSGTPVEGTVPAPPKPIHPGSEGEDVFMAQCWLNRLSTSFAVIPKINPADGFFGDDTYNAVKAFQQLFNLQYDGVIKTDTWFRLQFAYLAVKRMGERVAQNANYDGQPKQFIKPLKIGDTGEDVKFLQYMLNLAAMYNNAIEPFDISGIFDTATENAVKAFAMIFGQSSNGVVTDEIYKKLFDVYLGVFASLPDNLFLPGNCAFPEAPIFPGATGEGVKKLQNCINFISRSYGELSEIREDGKYGGDMRKILASYQQQFGLPVCDIVNFTAWSSITALCDDIRAGLFVNEGQYPGYILDEGLEEAKKEEKTEERNNAAAPRPGDL